MNVAVIGASNKPHRYSYRALMLLKEKGHVPYPVHQRITDIEGMHVFSSIKDITDAIDTVTLYVSADISDVLGDDIIAARPQRIIFNPGAENAVFAKKANGQGILTINACTLVMLNTGQF